VLGTKTQGGKIVITHTYSWAVIISSFIYLKLLVVTLPAALLQKDQGCFNK